MSRVLVTGGLGFIGRHLIERLVKEGHSVSCLDRKGEQPFGNKVSYISVDMKDYDYVGSSISKDYDAIFHLASFINVGEMIKNPKLNISNNINATLNLLEDIRLNNPKCLLIFSSSEKVYGNPSKSQIPESYSTIPADPYGSSKLISESLILSYHFSYGVPYVIFRSGNTFGPGQNPGLFIPSVISRIKKGEKKLVVGNLEAYRNFIYVEDAVSAFIAALKYKNAQNNIFNISSYNENIGSVLKSVVKRGENFQNSKIEISQDRSLFRESELKAKRFVLDCSKARKILHWKPSLSFDKALELTFKGTK